MKIAILDDYQDCVRHLDCFNLLTGHEVKIFTNGARGIGQLAIRLAGFDAIVLIRERSRIPSQLLSKLPNLKVISQTGKVTAISISRRQPSAELRSSKVQATQLRRQNSHGR